ncbi:exodeoxyribonuclease V subunit beta [Reinekea thalattae]|uniref:RecBCD enzyme subunit RecB n=1 Tax=Reinekea thalattae TaxID=2593301 RepID=A0A5C8Z2D6_9GAMM|nr:exodeoxyribonuclease V subunit beta [Reinekea thalattae]TXR51373.1 exodeoxyribonuclease V subunit beta [Reinekea thalattae]
MKPLDITALPLTGSHLIEASAGTGKTYNILRLYLRLLLEKNLSVQEILVMTFTNAATAELRSRLSEFLRDTRQHWLQSEEATVVQLRQTLSAEQADFKLRQAILHLDEASIFTIHGFCKRALAEQAFLSGASFNLNLDGDSDDILLQAAEDFYRHNIDQIDFAQLHDAWPTPENFVAHWRIALTTSDDIEKPQLQAIEPKWQQFLQHWPEEKKAFIKLNVETKRINAGRLANNIEDLELINTAVAENDWQCLNNLSQDIIKRCFDGKAKEASLSSSREFISALKQQQKAALICAALEGVEFIRQRAASEKARLDQLDFNDLISQLKHSLFSSQGDALASALQQSYPAVLVDEFQDTDPDQYAILDKIYPASSEAFMCLIGDPKQAIYSFRGGDVFAYLKAKQQAKHHWSMNTNYRSSQAVVEGYNRIFLADEEQHNSRTFGFDIDYRKVDAALGSANFSDSNERSAVQWVNIEPEEMPSRGLNKAFCGSIARWCAQEIIHLLTEVNVQPAEATGEPANAIKPGDIALLVRSHSEAQLLQGALSEAGLASVFLSARDNVFNSHEAGQLHQLLQGIWHYQDDRLFVSALASHWLQLSVSQLDQLQTNEQHWATWLTRFEQWRNQWQTKGLMSMLLSVLQYGQYPFSTDSQRQLTNMLHLAELLQKESTRLREPEALLHWFAQTIQQDNRATDETSLRLDSDDDLIKIVTMHGSKGLEYPIVFLPFVSFYSQSNKTPALLRYHDRSSFQAKQSYLHSDEVIRLAAEEEAAERVRLFYVAATRAKLRLYICAANFSSFKQSSLGQTLKLNGFIKEQFPLVEPLSWLTIAETDIGQQRWQTDASQAEISVATFQGHIERDWWLSSFSSLTRNLKHNYHDQPDRDPQPVDVVELPSNELRFRLAKGAEAGNLLHDTLEQLDFNQPNFELAYQQCQTRYSSLTETFSEAELRQWLEQILHAPLPQGGKLADLSWQTTLREAEFYFPMAGGESKPLAEFIRQRRQADFQLPGHSHLKGMMHGFIDLIFQHQGRFYIADYKSNYLGSRVDDYVASQVLQNIYHSNYDVQYFIYCLALHRYLKNRLPNYQPEQHFGGVYYFYLRGMNTENSQGIYHRTVSAEELNRLDAIFSKPTELA